MKYCFIFKIINVLAWLSFTAFIIWLSNSYWFLFLLLGVIFTDANYRERTNVKKELNKEVEE